MTDEMMAFREELSKRLQRTCLSSGIRSAAVGVYRDADVYFCTVGSTDKKEPFFSSTPVKVGCLAKAFTATLVAEGVARGDISFDATISDLLPTVDWAEAAAVTAQNLLNHTHAFDDSAVGACPRARNGHIDTQHLASRLQSAPRLFRRGVTYSYGDAGHWLAAAALERMAGRTYAELLRDDLFPAAAIDWRPSSLTGICSSFGGSLTLSCEQLIAFSRHYLRLHRAAHPTQQLTRTIVPYPGWNPTSRAATCGWNDYGDGWFGHNALIGSHSVILRFQPDRNLALVVTSHTPRAFHAAAGVFGDVLPELRNPVRAPRRLLQKEITPAALHKHCGTYENQAVRINVERSARVSLPLNVSVHPKGATNRVLQFHLQPAQHGVFFAIPSDPQFFAIQFPLIDERAYLWNGTGLFGKTSPTVDPR